MTQFTHPHIMSTQHSMASIRKSSKRRPRIPQQKSFDDELEKQLSSLEGSDENDKGPIIHQQARKSARKYKRAKKQSLSQVRGEMKGNKSHRTPYNHEVDTIERMANDVLQDDGYMNRLVDPGS